jgi:hypothetical protein
MVLFIDAKEAPADAEKDFCPPDERYYSLA